MKEKIKQNSLKIALGVIVLGWMIFLQVQVSGIKNRIDDLNTALSNQGAVLAFTIQNLPEPARTTIINAINNSQKP